MAYGWRMRGAARATDLELGCRKPTPRRFERPTSAFAGLRSIQLSYGVFGRPAAPPKTRSAAARRTALHNKIRRDCRELSPPDAFNPRFPPIQCPGMRLVPPLAPQGHSSRAKPIGDPEMVPPGMDLSQWKAHESGRQQHCNPPIARFERTSQAPTG